MKISSSTQAYKVPIWLVDGVGGLVSKVNNVPQSSQQENEEEQTYPTE